MPLTDTAFAIVCLSITMSPFWDVIAPRTFPSRVTIGLLFLWTATQILLPLLTYLDVVFHGIGVVLCVPAILYDAMMIISIVLLHAFVYATSALSTKRALWIEGCCVAAVFSYRYAVGWLNRTTRDRKLERERKNWLHKIEIDDYQYAWGIDASLETARYEADRIQWNDYFDRESREEATDIITAFAQSLSAEQELARLQLEAEQLQQALIDIAMQESREEDRVFRACSYADAVQNVTSIVIPKYSRQAGLRSSLRI